MLTFICLKILLSPFKETIGKFRSLVKELQEQNAELRTTQLQEQEVKEPSQQQPAATAAAAKDYQIKMSETKVCYMVIFRDICW